MEAANLGMPQEHLGRVCEVWSVRRYIYIYVIFLHFIYIYIVYICFHVRKSGLDI